MFHHCQRRAASSRVGWLRVAAGDHVIPPSWARIPHGTSEPSPCCSNDLRAAPDPCLSRGERRCPCRDRQVAGRESPRPARARPQGDRRDPSSPCRPRRRSAVDQPFGMRATVPLRGDRSRRPDRERGRRSPLSDGLPPASIAPGGRFPHQGSGRCRCRHSRSRTTRAQRVRNECAMKLGVVRLLPRWPSSSFDFRSSPWMLAAAGCQREDDIGFTRSFAEAAADRHQAVTAPGTSAAT
jgi:hypothetical protein